MPLLLLLILSFISIALRIGKITDYMYMLSPNILQTIRPYYQKEKMYAKVSWIWWLSLQDTQINAENFLFCMQYGMIKYLNWQYSRGFVTTEERIYKIRFKGDISGALSLWHSKHQVSTARKASKDIPKYLSRWRL